MGMVPCILVTGFLGAGKTTLLNRLIGYYSQKVDRLAVMVNEFGSIGLDGALLVPGGYYKSELNRGSIFCACIRTDFIAEIRRLAEDVKPDLLIIEATGIARVDDLYAMLGQNAPDGDSLRGLVKVEKNICVLDARSFYKVAATLAAVQSQAAYADVFILNKIDLAGTEDTLKTEAAVRNLNKTAPILPASFCACSMETLEAGSVLGTNVHSKDGPTAPSAAPSTDIPDEFFSFSLELKGIMDPHRFRQCIKELLPILYRGKGVVRYKDGPKYFEVVDHSYSEKDVPEVFIEGDENIIVLIRSTFIHKPLAEMLKSCLL